MNTIELSDYLQTQGILCSTVRQFSDGTFQVVTVNPSQQAAANNIVKTCPTLDWRKQQAINAFYAQATTIVDDRYSPSVLAAFAVMIATGKKNQAAYCQQLFDWGMSIQASYNMAKTQIQAAASIAAVNAVIFDAQTLINADPQITLAAAIAIKN